MAEGGDDIPFGLSPDGGEYPLSGTLNGSYRWASSSLTQDPLATFWNTQIAVWVDDNRHGRIAKRLHGRAWGASVDLFGVAGTALGAQFTEDSHNVIVCGVDSRGFVHVAGDMHAVALKYMRSTKPLDVSAWSSPGMVGTEESSVTYPAFVRCLDGTLLFFYRDGTSGNGDLILNVYNTTTQTWTRRAKVIDGKTNSLSAYPQRIAVDRNTGRLHLMWMWRDTGLASTTHDLCYAYSDDNGTTWRKTDGTAYVLPITKATAETVYDTADTGAGLRNQGGLDVDVAGRPHAAFIQSDGNDDQIRHVYYDGSSWHNDQVTSFTGSWGILRPQVVCFSTGTVWIVFSTDANGRDFEIRVLDVTVPASPVESVLHNSDMLNWEPAFDTWALLQRDELHMFGAYMRGEGAQGGDPADLAAQVNPPILVFNEGSI